MQELGRGSRTNPDLDQQREFQGRQQTLGLFEASERTGAVFASWPLRLVPTVRTSVLW